jgi:acyl-CoA thioesterase FadM
MTSIRLRVWPNDLDINRHVNNGRYLTLADLARMDWFLRTGVFAAARQHQAFPVIGDAIAKFRRDLRLFQSFEIRTRMIGWDHKWGFLEHRFVRAGRIIGVVAIRGVFKSPQGPVDPQQLLAQLHQQKASPECPVWANNFHQAAESLSALLREEERREGLR